ncbi:MAG: O-antigen ligase family protein [Candidatus Falkowbacteria bacterium]
MQPKTYLAILKYGLYSSFLTFFFIFSDLLFPYITSKQISFNILMEVLAVFWVMLIMTYPEYRPKKSYLTWGILAYFFAVALSAIFGVDFNLSFWGNAERMLGLLHLLHFFLFYLILITVMRGKSDWDRFFDVSIATSVAITIYGLATAYPASTIGNTAYVAGLMIFNFFFALWRIFSLKDWYLRGVYILASIMILVGFVRSDISGSQAGLVAGLAVMGIIFFFLQKGKKMKIVGGIVMGLMFTLLVLLFAFRSNPIFDNTKIGGMLKAFSSQNITLNTRLLSWRAAYLDFSNHPILGVGHGNYAAIFDKHFTPKFYDYSPNETYFDRAHNNIVDIVSTTGVLGLLAYLSIFVAVFFYLIKAYKQKKINAWQIATLSGLIVAYFVQNLAVFDSLVTYVSLFGLLGFIYFAYNQSEIKEVSAKKSALSDEKELALWVIMIIIALVFVNNFNIRGFKMLGGVIDGYQYVASGEPVEGAAIYQKAFAKSVGYNRDSRGTILNLITGEPKMLLSLPQKDAEEVLVYVVELARQNADYNPNDSLIQTQLAKIANIAARFNYKDMEKFNDYSSISLSAIDTAIAASPGRFPLYYVKSDIHLTRGEKDEAIAALKKSIELKPDYPDAYCNLAKVYNFFKDYNQAYEAAGTCAKMGKASLLGTGDVTAKALEYFLQKKDNETAKYLQDYLIIQEQSIQKVQ